MSHKSMFLTKSKLLCRFIAFAQAVLNAEIFLLGELQLVAKGQLVIIIIIIIITIIIKMFI